MALNSPQAFLTCDARWRSRRSFRTRNTTLDVQSTAITIAIPPYNTWLGSGYINRKKNAKPQQPSATMTGIIKFCVPRTGGETKRPFATGAAPLSVGLLAGTFEFAFCFCTIFFFVVEVPLLRFLVFGINLIHFHLILEYLGLSTGAVPLEGFSAFWKLVPLQVFCW
jgi:hypothetical protein